MGRWDGAEIGPLPNQAAKNGNAGAAQYALGFKKKGMDFGFLGNKL